MASFVQPGALSTTESTTDVIPFPYAMRNGVACSYAEMCLHVSDVGVVRGYGLFDFFRVLAGVPVFLEDHLARLRRSAALLGIPLDYRDAELRTQVLQVCQHNGNRDAGMVLLLTGGEAPDGFNPLAPNLLIFQRPLPTYPAHAYQQGVGLISHAYRRDLPSIKSTNYAMALKLRPQMQAAGAVDVLFYDAQSVRETTRCNIFARQGACVWTPAQDILEGVTRKQVLALLAAREDIRLEPRDLTLAELQGADEVFITSSTKQVMPVTQLDGQPIGDGAVGWLSRALQQQFDQRVAEYLAQHGARQST